MDNRVMSVRAEQWRKILEAQMASGLTKEKWCEENGVPRWQFYRWQKKIREMELSGTNSSPESDSGKQDLLEDKLSFAEVPMKLLPGSSSSNTEDILSPSSYIGSSDICISYEKFRVFIRSGSINARDLAAILKAVRYAD